MGRRLELAGKQALETGPVDGGETGPQRFCRASSG
jgi:hypothetical protein